MAEDRYEKPFLILKILIKRFRSASCSLGQACSKLLFRRQRMGELYEQIWLIQSGLDAHLDWRGTMDFRNDEEGKYLVFVLSLITFFLI